MPRRCPLPLEPRDRAIDVAFTRARQRHETRKRACFEQGVPMTARPGRERVPRRRVRPFEERQRNEARAQIFRCRVRLRRLQPRQRRERLYRRRIGLHRPSCALDCRARVAAPLRAMRPGLERRGVRAIHRERAIDRHVGLWVVRVSPAARVAEARHRLGIPRPERRSDHVSLDRARKVSRRVGDRRRADTLHRRRRGRSRPRPGARRLPARPSPRSRSRSRQGRRSR